LRRASGADEVAPVATAQADLVDVFGTPRGRPRAVAAVNTALAGKEAAQPQGVVGLLNNDLLFASAASDASWA
jgi:hypothetical protein